MGRRYGFGSIPKLFHLTVNGFDPVILIFLRIALKPHNDPTDSVITGLCVILSSIPSNVFNMLEFVNFKGCFIIRDHITYSDLIDAETEKSVESGISLSEILLGYKAPLSD